MYFYIGNAKCRMMKAYLRKEAMQTNDGQKILYRKFFKYTLKITADVFTNVSM